MVQRKSVKTPKKVVEKPYNSASMTNAAFWGFIRSTLRRASRYWKPIQECKNNAKRKSQSSNKKLKWEFNCSGCNGWFPDKLISVDHINACGSLSCAEDLPGFVTRLFCTVDNLDVLCYECHLIKTAEDKIKIKKSKENV